MLFSVDHIVDTVNIFNVDSEDVIDATGIAKIVVEDAEFHYTGRKRGWRGGVAQMLLAIDKLKELGWSQSYNSADSVRDTTRVLIGGI